MRAPLDFDDVERLEATARTAAAHREAAVSLTSWAEERHPEDEVSPADLLSAAAWHLDQAGHRDAGLELHRRAVMAAGTTTPDARCMLAAALLEAERADEAEQVANDLRRSRPRIVDIASMAEVFEMVGDLRQAHRWTALGLSRLELDDEADAATDLEVELLLNVRSRVREALGFPPDEFDETGV